jgi:hypothetical protein
MKLGSFGQNFKQFENAMRGSSGQPKRSFILENKRKAS